MPRIPSSPSNLKTGNLVVVAPHPDDEALGAGGLISQFVENGHRVDVILLTNGDGFVQDAERYYLTLEVTPEEYLNLGYRRMRETLDAMAVLGVGPEHVHFLGFPDGGLDQLLFNHWVGEPFRSLTTGATKSPYIETLGGNTPYLGRELLSLLRRLFLDIKPRWVVAPSGYDEHPDHWATGAFARLAGTGSQFDMQHLSYLVHWPAWPLPLAFRPLLHQRAPEALYHLNPRRWREFVFDSDTVMRKRRALMAYQSQVELIKPFMLAFARLSEMLMEESVSDMPSSDGDEVNGQATDLQWITLENPSRNAWTKWFNQDAPIHRVRWGILNGYQRVQVELRRSMTVEETFHVSLHMPHTSTMRHWRVDAAGVASGLRSEVVKSAMTGRLITVAWPLTEYDHNQVAMLGVQISNDESWQGRIPMERYCIPIENTLI